MSENSARRSQPRAEAPRPPRRHLDLGTPPGRGARRRSAGCRVVIGLIARSRDRGQIRFTGLTGHAVNAGVIIVLLVNPYTAGCAALFYGVTMLVAAWRGQRGCESTVISNLILRRDDQIGCPLFLPADEAEARWAARSRSRRGTARSD